MKPPLYLDYHATTPVDPRVLEAMLPYFTERFGNASSRNHAYGWAAGEALDVARAQVAALVGAHHKEIVFTSGATESNNIAIRGVVAAARHRGRHVVTVATEHHSVLDTCRALERDGCDVTWLPVGPDGLVDVARLESALTEGTVLVSVMLANNEIGVVQPLAEIGRLTRKRGIALHTDASQAAGKIPFDVNEAQVDLAAFTGHKLYGPKGVGALYVRRRPRVDVAPLLHGGGQEGGLRPGTLNVPGIVGFGKACEICRLEMDAERPKLAALRDRLLAGLRREIDGLRVNGSLAARLPHNLSVSVPGVDGSELVTGLDDIAVSSGAACAAARSDPSHVLTALGVERELALATIRFGLGRWTNEAEVDYAIGRIGRVVAHLRSGPGVGARAAQQRR
jgi:cysteine desulfurase